MTYYAYELKAMFDAGLQMSDPIDGEIQWIGTDEQWRDALCTIRYYETFTD